MELSCNYLGGICADMNDYFHAHEYYMEGMNACVALVQDTKDPVHWDDLGVLYFNFYRMTGSGSAFDQAYFVWDKLTREHPENETYAQRLAILKNLM